MKMLWELEVSNDIRERTLFVKKVSQKIQELELRMKEALPDVDTTTFERILAGQGGVYTETIKQLAQECLDNLLLSQQDNEVTKSRLFKQERSYINLLKKKLENYDIYRQNMPYICARCKENVTNCVCESVEIKEKTQLKIDDIPF